MSFNYTPMVFVDLLLLRAQTCAPSLMLLLFLPLLLVCPLLLLSFLFLLLLLFQILSQLLKRRLVEDGMTVASSAMCSPVSSEFSREQNLIFR